VLSFFQDTYAWADVGNTTSLHPAGLAALGVLVAMIMAVPRTWSLAPLLMLTCLVPAGQRVVIAGLDFTFLRLLVMFAWLRILVRGEIRPIRWSYLDFVVIVWAVVAAALETLRAEDPGKAIINRMGYALDALGTYFYFRIQLRGYGDLERATRTLILTAFPVLVFFLIESLTRFNFFHIFGGVPQTTMIRNGRLRCQGPYSHPILAGCFWAVLLPLFLVRVRLARDHLLTIAGVVAALGIVAASASSTPVMAVFFGVAGFAFWPFRGAMRWFRWMVLGVGLALHFALMEKPIWHLMARIDFVGGSTGYHRFNLMDACINNFHEWWLMGIDGTGHWGWGLQDITNHYVYEAVGGGVWRLAAFLTMLAFSFVAVGRALRHPALSKSEKLVAWAMGTSMFAHSMNFLAVSYFNQILVIWYFHIAIIASLFRPPGAVKRQTRERLAEIAAPDPEPEPPQLAGAR